MAAKGQGSQNGQEGVEWGFIIGLLIQPLILYVKSRRRTKKGGGGIIIIIKLTEIVATTPFPNNHPLQCWVLIFCQELASSTKIKCKWFLCQGGILWGSQETKSIAFQKVKYSIPPLYLHSYVLFAPRYKHISQHAGF